MKSLISANVVKAAHAAGQLRLAADPLRVIVTAEARSVASRLGIVLDAAPMPAVVNAAAEEKPRAAAWLRTMCCKADRCRCARPGWRAPADPGTHSTG